MILAEDLIDDGGTIDTARNYLAEHGVVKKGTDAVVLMRKHKATPVSTPVTMVGFDDVPDVC